MSRTIEFNTPNDIMNWLYSGKAFREKAPRFFGELKPEIMRYYTERFDDAVACIRKRTFGNYKRHMVTMSQHATPDEVYQLMINSQTQTNERTFESNHAQRLFYYGKEHAKIGTEKEHVSLSNREHRKNANPETRSKTPVQIEFWTRKGYSVEDAAVKVAEFQEKAQSKAREVYHNHRRDWWEVSFWTEKGMSEEDARAEVDRRLANCREYSINTLESFIERHGEEEGRTRWKTYTDKLRKKMRRNLISGKMQNASKVSIRLFDRLVKVLQLNPADVMMKHVDYSNAEFGIEFGDGAYFYDFKYKNVIIEYNSTLWHYHPDYAGQYRWKDDPEKIRLSIELDKIKVDLAEKNGYHLLTIWDYDKKSVMLEQCKAFINEHCEVDND